MNNKAIEALVCQHVVDLTPYESARRLFSAADSSQERAQTWMNANEAPECGSYQVDSRFFNRYPDCQPEEVIQAYAKYTGLDANQTLVTRGADEGIELVIRAFCDAGKDNILICPPTYGMYAISAQTFNVGVKKAQLLPDFSLDIASVKSFVGQVKVVFICSPNNPTGTRVDQSQIIEVLEAFKDQAIVVLDEAYIEFDETEAQVDLLSKYDNLIILRTLSKAFALAGLRCGFSLASPDIITTLLKVIAPYPLAAPVAQIASEALNPNGISIMRDNVQLLNGELVKMKQALQAIGDIEIVGEISGNFVLFRTQQKQALMDFLVSKGMLIRDQSKQIMLDNCLRISIGTPDQNKALLALISNFYANGGQ